MQLKMSIGAITGFLLFGVIVTVPSMSQASNWSPGQLLEFTRETCQHWERDAVPAEGFGVKRIDQSVLRIRGTDLGTRFRLDLNNNALVELDVVIHGGQLTRFVSSHFNEFGDPLVMVSLGSDCSLQVVRKVNYTDHGQATDIVTLDADLQPQGDPDWLNPPLVFIEQETEKLPHQSGEELPVRVGMIDSGVNYQLPEINRRLARDRDGGLVGFDFWDMDALPFDAHPLNAGFFLQRHGTRTASLLLREAPGVELVPYRYPRPDMSRMQALVEHAAENGVAILGMPLGSNRPEDWNTFARAAREHPEILFIASAGNNGRDIDKRPVYPAALGLDNMLVVTSADDFVQPAERTNWGRLSVDYLVPAERLPALDYSGTEVRVSGSSYAVSRIAAFAARIKASNPDWEAGEIIAELRQNAVENEWVGMGYIADPLAGAQIDKRDYSGLDFPSPSTEQTGFRLSLDILVLDSDWSRQRIERTVQQAYQILQQCDIVPGDISAYTISGSDYLKDLDTGTAHTLFHAVDKTGLTVVFARDTRMQAAYLGEAFGRGNTRQRPWLTDSVWLMRDVEDAEIALAHELYHVIANSGAHVEGVPNLMQARTRPESVELTLEQCRRAQTVGTDNQLLQEVAG